ncbi:MAG: 30S ribosomal protein S21 [Dehalococcoidia bacterium]|nr:30S ribosomal protein S21 [Dehalococcoidia bacterium]
MQVTLRDGETQEGLLARFTKVIQREGILKEARSRRHFVSNRDKARAAERKSAKRRRRGGR